MKAGAFGRTPERRDVKPGGRVLPGMFASPPARPSSSSTSAPAPPDPSPPLLSSLGTSRARAVSTSAAAAPSRLERLQAAAREKREAGPSGGRAATISGRGGGGDGGRGAASSGGEDSDTFSRLKKLGLNRASRREATPPPSSPDEDQSGGWFAPPQRKPLSGTSAFRRSASPPSASRHFRATSLAVPPVASSGASDIVAPEKEAPQTLLASLWGRAAQLVGAGTGESAVKEVPPDKRETASVVGALEVPESKVTPFQLHEGGTEKQPPRATTGPAALQNAVNRAASDPTSSKPRRSAASSLPPVEPITYRRPPALFPRDTLLASALAAAQLRRNFQRTPYDWLDPHKDVPLDPFLFHRQPGRAATRKTGGGRASRAARPGMPQQTASAPVLGAAAVTGGAAKLGAAGAGGGPEELMRRLTAHPSMPTSYNAVPVPSDLPSTAPAYPTPPQPGYSQPPVPPAHYPAPFSYSGPPPFAQPSATAAAAPNASLLPQQPQPPAFPPLPPSPQPHLPTPSATAPQYNAPALVSAPPVASAPPAAVVGPAALPIQPHPQAPTQVYAPAPIPQPVARPAPSAPVYLAPPPAFAPAPVQAPLGAQVGPPLAPPQPLSQAVPPIPGLAAPPASLPATTAPTGATASAGLPPMPMPHTPPPPASLPPAAFPTTSLPPSTLPSAPYPPTFPPPASLPSTSLPPHLVPFAHPTASTAAAFYPAHLAPTALQPPVPPTGVAGWNGQVPPIPPNSAPPVPPIAPLAMSTAPIEVPAWVATGLGFGATRSSSSPAVEEAKPEERKPERRETLEEANEPELPSYGVGEGQAASLAIPAAVALNTPLPPSPAPPAPSLPPLAVEAEDLDPALPSYNAPAPAPSSAETALPSTPSSLPLLPTALSVSTALPSPTPVPVSPSVEALGGLEAAAQILFTPPTPVEPRPLALGSAAVEGEQRTEEAEQRPASPAPAVQPLEPISLDYSLPSLTLDLDFDLFSLLGGPSSASLAGVVSPVESSLGALGLERLGAELGMGEGGMPYPARASSPAVEFGEEEEGEEEDDPLSDAFEAATSFVAGFAEADLRRAALDPGHTERTERWLEKQGVTRGKVEDLRVTGEQEKGEAAGGIVGPGISRPLTAPPASIAPSPPSTRFSPSLPLIPSTSALPSSSSPSPLLTRHLSLAPPPRLYPSYSDPFEALPEADDAPTPPSPLETSFHAPALDVLNRGRVVSLSTTDGEATRLWHAGVERVEKAEGAKRALGNGAFEAATAVAVSSAKEEVLKLELGGQKGEAKGKEAAGLKEDADEEVKAMAALMGNW